MILVGAAPVHLWKASTVLQKKKNKSAKKDTSRLLVSGAWKVFWLRVLKDHLREGIEALFELIPSSTVTVCESNSVRTCVEPGIFLMAKNKSLITFKPSARIVQSLADRVVEFDPERLEDKPFDFDLDEIQLRDNNWVVNSKHQKHENA